MVIMIMNFMGKMIIMTMRLTQEYEEYLREKRRRGKGKGLPRRSRESTRSVPSWNPPKKDEGDVEKDGFDLLQEKLVAQRELCDNEDRRKR